MENCIMNNLDNSSEALQEKKLEISSNKSQLKKFIPKLFQQEAEIHPFDSHDSRIVLLLMHTCKKLSNYELPFKLFYSPLLSLTRSR